MSSQRGWLGGLRGSDRRSAVVACGAPARLQVVLVLMLVLVLVLVLVLGLVLVLVLVLHPPLRVGPPQLSNGVHKQLRRSGNRHRRRIENPSAPARLKTRGYSK